MTTVWICQCLCPSRHCIMAAAGETDRETDPFETIRTPLRHRVVEMLRSGKLNPWCALCGAHRATWSYELRPMEFRTLEEAMPTLIEVEALNLATNAAWGDLHKTSRPN